MVKVLVIVTADSPESYSLYTCLTDQSPSWSPLFLLADSNYFITSLIGMVLSLSTNTLSNINDEMQLSLMA